MLTLCYNWNISNFNMLYCILHLDGFLNKSNPLIFQSGSMGQKVWPKCNCIDEYHLISTTTSTYAKYKQYQLWYYWN